MFNKVEFQKHLLTAISTATSNGTDHTKPIDAIVRTVANDFFEKGDVFLTKGDAESTLKLFNDLNDGIVSRDFRQSIILIFLAAVTLVLAGLRFNGIISSNIFLYTATASATLGVFVHFGCKVEKNLYIEELKDSLSETFVRENGDQGIDDCIKTRKDSDVNEGDDVNEADSEVEE